MGVHGITNKAQDYDHVRSIERILSKDSSDSFICLRRKAWTAAPVISQSNIRISHVNGHQFNVQNHSEGFYGKGREDDILCHKQHLFM